MVTTAGAAAAAGDTATAGKFHFRTTAACLSGEVLATFGKELGAEPGSLLVGGLMFHQTIEGLGLSIEEGTANVPHDGRFYVLAGGRVDRSYRNLRDATRRYQSLKTGVPTATDAGVQ